MLHFFIIECCSAVSKRSPHAVSTGKSQSSFSAAIPCAVISRQASCRNRFRYVLQRASFSPQGTDSQFLCPHKTVSETDCHVADGIFPFHHLHMDLQNGHFQNPEHTNSSSEKYGLIIFANPVSIKSTFFCKHIQCILLAAADLLAQFLCGPSLLAGQRQQQIHLHPDVSVLQKASFSSLRMIR